MKAVVLAGGLGTRLTPYTTTLPKPLMPIGDKPILEIVIRQLKYHGFDHVILAVNHMAELLISYFGDGGQLGVNIEYSREAYPLGTAGPLKLIPESSDIFLAMNGDILTDLNYSDMLASHRASKAIATMGVCPRTVETDLGVVEFDDDKRLTDYIEKPTHKHWVSMGIYIFEPRTLEFIPKEQRFDLPDLMNLLISAGETVNCFPHEGYWQDIGRIEDYQNAQTDFDRLSGDLLPPC